MRKQSYLVCSAALLFAATACSDSTGLKAGISQADANQLAADMDAVSTIGTSDVGLGVSFSIGVDQSGSSVSVAAAPFPIDNHFTVTRQCPRGGNATIDGSVVGTGDRVAHNLTLDATATRTDKDCAFDTREGVLTLNAALAYTGHLNIVGGLLSGLQTQTHSGTFSWARNGTGGNCTVNITSSYDPATHTATIKGSICGHDIDVTKTRAG